MKRNEIKPNVRFADKLNYTASRGYTKTYDCRMLYMLSGNGTIDVEENTVAIHHGVLILFQPGTKYRLNPQNSFCAFAIDFDFTDEEAEETDIFLPLTLEQFDAAKAHKVIHFTDCDELNSPLISEAVFSVEENLTALTEEFHSMNCFRSEIASSLLRLILFKILKSYSTDKMLSDTAEAVKDYIHKNYGKKIKNTQIATALNYEPCYLNRIFTASAGITIHRYLVQYRMNEALKYLLTTDLSIEKIAELTGFYNTGHFSAAFKRHTGNVPSIYRTGSIRVRRTDDTSKNNNQKK